MTICTVYQLLTGCDLELLKKCLHGDLFANVSCPVQSRGIIARPRVTWEHDFSLTSKHSDSDSQAVLRVPRVRGASR